MLLIDCFGLKFDNTSCVPDFLLPKSIDVVVENDRVNVGPEVYVKEIHFFSKNVHAEMNGSSLSHLTFTIKACMVRKKLSHGHSSHSSLKCEPK